MRMLQKLTLKGLGDKVRMSPSYISHIESGRRDPDTKLLIQLAKALGCFPQDFFEGKATISFAGALDKLQLTENDLVMIKALRRLEIKTPQDLEQMYRLQKAVREQMEP